VFHTSYIFLSNEKDPYLQPLSCTFFIFVIPFDWANDKNGIRDPIFAWADFFGFDWVVSLVGLLFLGFDFWGLLMSLAPYTYCI
jgi:hypothetical protein